MNILRSLYGIIREITSPPAPDLNVEIVSMWIHPPSGSSISVLPSFPQQTTRIVCELDLRTVRWEPTRLYKLVFRCTSLRTGCCGKITMTCGSMGRQHFLLKTGWDKPGLRPPGHYKIHLLLDGVEVAHIFIDIENPPPPPPPIEMLQQPSVKFYEWEQGRFGFCLGRPGSVQFYRSERG